MACTSTVMYEGDTHGWHFDLNDFVVSILLQAPEAGGTFDFAPNIRDDGDENYPAVAAAIDGRSEGVRSIKVEAGNVAALLRPPCPASGAAGARQGPTRHCAV